MKIIIILILIFVLLMVLIILESIRELSNLKVTEYNIDAPENLKGKKLIFLSDYHEAAKLNDKIINEIKRISPDMILIGGDMLNGKSTSEDTAPAVELINSMADVADIYYAMGNHERKLIEDIYGTGSIWEDFKAEVSDKVHFLNNQKVEPIEDMVIYGLDLELEYFARFVIKKPSKEEMLRLLGAPDKSKMNILLGHAPDLYSSYKEWGADLSLAGHFHGGIVRLPLLGGVISPRFRFFPKYDHGLYEEDGAKMIVTSGLGQHSMKLRLGNIPELVLINLV